MGLPFTCRPCLLIIALFENLERDHKVCLRRQEFRLGMLQAGTLARNAARVGPFAGRDLSDVLSQTGVSKGLGLGCRDILALAASAWPSQWCLGR